MADIDVTLSKIKDSQEDKLVAAVNQMYEADVHNKNLRSANWSQNAHFYAGDQWIKFSEVDRQWKSIPVTRLNKAIDRPISNYTLVFTNINASSFTNRPIITIDPNSDDPRDKSAAKASQIVLDFLWEHCEKDDDYYEAALWMLITGTVFRKSSKVYAGKSIRVPTGEINPKTARKITEKIGLKKNAIDIVSPFNMSFDGLPKRWKDVRLLMESEIKSLDWIKENFEKDAGEGTGYTGRTEEVKEETNLNNVMTIGEGLKNIVEGNNQTGYAFQATEVKDCAVIKEAYCVPSERFPKGRMIVVANNVLLYRGPSPYYYQEGRIWHPFTMCQYLKMPGSIFGISLVGQMQSKQRSINSIDALVAYNRKSIGVGKWLKPTGCGIPDETMVGTPGQEVTYNETPSGAKPELIAGVPLPAQTFQEREMHLNDMERIANNAGLKQGINPQGVKTIGQLQILQEQSNQSIGKPVEQWENFVQSSEELDLLNFQSCYLIPDPAVIAKLKKLSKELTGWDWSNFKGSDLQNNTSVKVSKGSTMTQSRAIQQQLILDLAQQGLLPDIMGDPYLYKLFLEKFGLTDLFNTANLDVQKAEWAIEQMLSGSYPPVIRADNPDIQLMVLTRYMKKPNYMEFEDDVKLLFERRFNEYVAALAKANAVSSDNMPEGGTLPAKVPTAPPPSVPMPGGVKAGKKAPGGSRRSAIAENVPS